MTQPADIKTLSLDAISPRAQAVLREVALSYVTTGEPMGSRTLSKLDQIQGSAATIRNVMADLEELGLLYAPHTSSGRLPTETGLRLFVEGLLQVGHVNSEERSRIQALSTERGLSSNEMLEKASQALSGLTSHASLVLTPKSGAAIKQIQFTPLSQTSALVILVLTDGSVENRVIELTAGTPSSSLITAGNFLTAKLSGLTLTEARQHMAVELAHERVELDFLTARLVEQGLVTQTRDSQDGVLIVDGQLNLLNDVQAVEDLSRVKHLIQKLESKQTYLKLMEAADLADGVQIFIGSQTELFGLSECSVVMKPYRNSDQQIIGAVGVIGPLRLNYGRVIPMVDFTADVVGKLLS